MINRTLSQYLIEIVKGMTKAEKKYFQLYARRNVKSKELKMLQLFDFISKTSDVNNDVIAQNFPELNGTQLSELKSRLYEQILICLRLLDKQNIEINIREQIDWASVLYSRGLYNQSLSILAKAKKLALQWHKDLLRLEILEFKKLIESRHVTKGYSNRLEELELEASTLNNSITAQRQWVKITANLFNLYIKTGHVKNLDEYSEVGIYFEKSRPVIEETELSFFGKVWMYQACASYHFNSMNFDKAILYAFKWVTLFEKDAELKKIEPELYIKGSYNLLALLFLCKDLYYFKKHVIQLDEFIDENVHLFGTNLKLRVFQFREVAQLNSFFLEGRFEEGVKHLDGFISRYTEYQFTINNHKVLSLEVNYKIACIYFGANDYKNAIKYLNANINSQNDSFRVDIQSFSRILFLISHFELGNKELLEYQLKTISNFLEKNKENQKIPSLIIEFLSTNLYAENERLKSAFIKLHSTISDIIQHNPFEKRLLLYCDLISWIESKIQGIPMEELVKKNLSQKKAVSN